jgi:predicted DNA binding CopG/RHH family protein
MIFALIAVPIANAQLGAPAYQKSNQLIIDEFNNIEAKHVIGFSNDPVMINLFEGAITDSITVTNENGKELEFAIVGMGDYGSVTIFSADENTIIKYNLRDIFRYSDNLITLNIGYPKTFGILFSEKIDQIFLGKQIIQLGDKKGISINGGGYVNVEYYSEMQKKIQEVQWKEDKFNVEIITDSKIDEFNFDQESKSISFQVNEKNKFVTINMEEKLLGGPYVILLDNEKIEFSQYSIKENYISLAMKPESSGEIMIIGTTVIPEFSMFIPLIMGFMIILTVPLMKKFSLR